MICLTLMENSIEENLKVLNKNRYFINMVELRLDMLHDPLLVSPDRVKSEFSISTIITYRKKSDGGKYEGSEEDRRSVLYNYSKAEFDYIDLELETSFPEIEKITIGNGTRIIRSYHNFAGIPDNFESIIRQLSTRPGDIAKAAVYPQNSSDTLKMYEVFEKVKDIKDKIILGMGNYGLSSRILYKKLGSMLSYCSNPENSGAPGHISPGEMVNLYRANEITFLTSVYGIIGNPVMHSRSPQIHNKAYLNARLDAVYIPFPVDNLSMFLKLATLLGVKGFSVTVPYKVEIINFLRLKSPELDSINSCNTVLREGLVWKGFNTDLNGFLKPLLSHIDISSIKKCAVIGAGGAARAIISALKSIGMDVSIFNRSQENGRNLALETDCSFYPLDRQDLLVEYNLIVQTTSVGMFPDENETPLPGYKFRKGQIAYDIIYTPLKTRFLKEAEEGGAATIGGLEMLTTQGIEQFEIFTNQPFPLVEQKENF
ncbi:MAG: shikimate dehydrogenase [Spirochaetia bacterium]|jgi:3-dehydroquinate dehydratase/shikimate dehydrogenase|nr:shikimate dehydrogenase [Spirochaetia bacterium]